MKNSKEISQFVLDSKVVNFEALGQTVAKLGPELAMLDDPWENFCGTMKYFIRIYRLPPIGPRVPELEGLEQLRDLQKQL